MITNGRRASEVRDFAKESGGGSSFETGGGSSLARGKTSGGTSVVVVEGMFVVGSFSTSGVVVSCITSATVVVEGTGMFVEDSF